MCVLKNIVKLVGKNKIISLEFLFILLTLYQLPEDLVYKLCLVSILKRNRDVDLKSYCWKCLSDLPKIRLVLKPNRTPAVV